MKKYYKNFGFTIVELLVVIVVIGILAAITIVAYSGISKKAISSTIQSDLTNASKQLKAFQAVSSTSSFPVSITDCPNPANTNICLKSSGTNSYTNYTVDNSTNPATFSLTESNGTIVYIITNDTAPVAVTVPVLTSPTSASITGTTATIGAKCNV